MRIIQITDDDAKELVAAIEMHKHRGKEFATQQEKHLWNEMHRAFHHDVVRWLQKHGAVLT